MIFRDVEVKGGLIELTLYFHLKNSKGWTILTTLFTFFEFSGVTVDFDPFLVGKQQNKIQVKKHGRPKILRFDHSTICISELKSAKGRNFLVLSVCNT